MARFQIIAKVPFLEKRPEVAPVTAARHAQDPQYANYVTIQKIIQMAGRIVRGDLDWGETLIVDDQFTWLYYESVRLGFVPLWFQPAVSVDMVMPPPISFAA
jgi:Rad3-related DNA helicase